MNKEKTSSILRGASVMAFATFLSRIMGLLREQSFAYFFGAGIWTDAFNVAFRIPNLLRDLFAEGAMSAAFVPTFNAAMKNEGKERAFQLISLTLSTLLIVVGVITILGMIFSPSIVEILASEFHSVPQKFEVTVLMTRIMFPFLLTVSWAAIAMGILNSLGEFFVPAIAPVFLNLALIVAGFTLCPFVEGFGYPQIVGMAVGATIGGFLQMGVQFPSLRKFGYSFQWLWNPQDPNLRKIVNLIIPGTIGLAAVQINIAISTVLATSQGTGAVSWLSYAFRLMQLPLGIFGVAIAQATLPVISRQAAENDHDSMGRTLASSIKLTAFINIAATLALMALSEPVIRLLFQHGRFTAADTAATALALQAYAVGLFFFSLIKVLTPAFYALNDTRTPVKASMISVVLNIILNVAFIKHFGYWSLALGTSLAAAGNSYMLYRNLSVKLKNIREAGIARSLVITLFASVLAALAMRITFMEISGLSSALHLFKAESLLCDSASLAIAAFTGIIALVVFARLFRLEEADQAWAMIRRKLFRSRGGKENLDAPDGNSP